jgi:hypothetical protein
MWTCSVKREREREGGGSERGCERGGGGKRGCERVCVKERDGARARGGGGGEGELAAAVLRQDFRCRLVRMRTPGAGWSKCGHLRGMYCIGSHVWPGFNPS